MLLAKMAAHHFKVVLTGEGSDELFGGYPWFKLHKLLRPVIPLPFSARRLLSQMLALRKRWQRASWVLATPVPLSLTGYKRLLGSEAWPLNVHLFSDTLQQQMIVESAREDAALPQDFEQWHPFTRLQYWELMVRLPDYILRHLDAASMAYSLEARVPFLDHELVELCAQIPPALKMRWLQEKHILRQALRGLLPPEILQRKKHSLAAPFRQWMRNLPEFAVELLSEQQIRDKGYFDHQVVGHMVQQHRAGNADYGRQLTGVVKVQLWDDLFQRGCQPTSY